MAQERRLLYLDEDLPKRLATELNRRGRHALSIYRDERKGTLDGDLVTMLYERFGQGVVLVTANESMPIQHEDALRTTGIALAIVDGDHGDVPQEAWKRETVHRWAHLIEEQEPGLWRRYSPHRRGKWTLRRRRPRLLVD
jgi:hypothetical protein